MNMPDGIWIALFFVASGVLGALIGRNEKKASEKKTEYFKNIPGITEEDVHESTGHGHDVSSGTEMK